jgi:ubiquinone biosynthesis accessory factor UbiJ
MFAHPSVRFLNHLLAQNSWALQRLARFSGKTVRFEVAPFSFSCRIMEDGSLLVSDAAAGSDARCVIPPSLLPRLAAHDENAQAGTGSEGDSELLAEIFFLSRNLRWDAAEDLSHVTGDIAAERLVAGARDVRQMLRNSAENLFRAGAEYLTEERPLLAKPGQLSAFMVQVDNLRDDLARLEQRINRLAASRKA